MAIAKGEQIAAWVQAARRGDERAFERLVRQFQDAVTGIVLVWVGRGPDVEDIAQEAFLAAFRQLGGFRDPGNFGPWVCGIARNLARRWARDRRRSAALPPGLAARSAPEASDLADRVMAAVQRLPPRLGETLTLFYINGYTTEEVAGLLEVPAGTVRRRLHEARRHLRQYVERTMADEIKRNAPKRGFAGKVTRSFAVEQRKAEPSNELFSATLTSDDPDFTQEVADQQWAEMKALITQGKFKPMGTRDKDGTKTYLYELILSDGQRIVHGTNLPLDPKA